MCEEASSDISHCWVSWTDDKVGLTWRTDNTYPNLGRHATRSKPYPEEEKGE
jgi:hypothetical protein